jgi:hypothetical protein
MKKLFLVLLFICSCSSTSTPVISSDSDIIIDNDNQIIVLDEDIIEQDEDKDVEIITDSICYMDSDCSKGSICVNNNCESGCKNDSDCSKYINTTCNLTLGRCVNEKAESGICSDSCSTCCYAGIGLKKVKCAPSVSSQYCGVCPQGQIFEPNSKTCLDSSCNSQNDLCSQLNSNSSNSNCFKCNDNNVCELNENCGYNDINPSECIAAGSQCIKDSKCCSGLPCLIGYCI